MTSARLPLALRVLAWRARPLVLALVLVGACAIGARAAAPPAPPTVAVVVAAADLRAGDVLAADDLRTVRMPATVVPSGTADGTGRLVGEELAVDLPRGFPVVDGHLTRSRFVTSAPAGTVAVPVHLADPSVAALLRPGDRVDLVAGTSDTWAAEGDPEVLATSALVLEVLTTSDDGAGPGVLGSAAVAAAADPLVVVAVGPQEGHRIAAAAGGSLGAVLVEGS